MDALLDSIVSFLETIGLTAFFSPNKRVYYPYLLAALVLASIYYWFLRQSKQQKSIPKWLQYIFPKSIWLHPSALVDYQLFVFNNVLKIVLIAPYFIAHGAFAYVVVYWWETAIGIQDNVQWSASSINISYTIVFMLCSDFSRFFLHYCLHKIPFLWEFHKVHHAAEVLTPITLYRIHPIEYMLFRLRSVFIFGLVTGSFFFWFRTGIEPIHSFQIHIGLFIFNMLGANLRHSHVPISFGRYLEHWLISPAQHQIHHGQAERFYDKNFGSFLAIWDWLFGSLMLSNPKEKIDFGIEPEEQTEFRSFWKNLWLPFRNFFQRISPF